MCLTVSESINYSTNIRFVRERLERYIKIINEYWIPRHISFSSNKSVH